MVRVERPDQEVLAARGRCLDNPAMLEDEANARHLVAVVDRGKLGERDLAFDRVLDRRVEDLAARHVDVAIVHRSAAAGERERQVGPVADDSHLVGPSKISRDPGHPLELGVPVEENGAVDELLELRERQPRLLGGRIGRVLADHPRDIHRHLPAPERLETLLEKLSALVREVGSLPHVLRGRDRDEGVAGLPHVELDRRRLGEHLERSLAHERPAELIPGELEKGERAAPCDLFLHRVDEWSGERSRPDDHLPSRLDADGAVYQEAGIFVDPRDRARPGSSIACRGWQQLSFVDEARFLEVLQEVVDR